MDQLTKHKYFIPFCCLLFIVSNALAIGFEFYLLGLIPVALLVAYYAINHYDRLIYLVVLGTPLSINAQDLIGGVGIFLPTEPLLIGVLLLFLLETIRRNPIDKKVLKHPISIAILLNLFWLGVSSYASEMPLVSYKFLTARLWFVVCMFYITSQIFKRFQSIKTFVWLYIISLLVVVAYTITIHAQNGFSEEVAHWCMTPFFNDHTSYGALLAFYFPIAIGLFIAGKNSPIVKGLLAFVIFVLAVALILSYTRAAWLSLIGALGVALILYFKINFKIVLSGVATLLVLLFVYADLITSSLAKNRQDSSDNLTEHVESVSNISTDASNLERLNRWSSAWKMFLDKPFFGFGPGTYQFQYAPYQTASDKTIISTNTGDGGNAHSEYLGPLAEAGLFGALSFLAIAITIIYKGVTLYSSIDKKHKEIRMLVMCHLLGIITYLIHGVLNNFLDTDKASVPFWSFAAALVAIELYHLPKQDEPKLN